MLLRGIASGKVPDQSHQRAHRRAEAKRRAPTEVQDDCGHQRRSETGEADAGEDEAVRLAALTDRKPALDKLAGGGKHGGLARAQGKAQQDEDDQRIANAMRNKRDQDDKDRPPHAQQSQGAARAKPPRQHAGGNLQACVANQECGEDPSHVDIADCKFLFNPKRGNRDIDAVEVNHRADDHQPEHKKIADRKPHGAGLAGIWIHRLHTISGCLFLQHSLTADQPRSERIALPLARLSFSARIMVAPRRAASCLVHARPRPLPAASFPWGRSPQG